MRSYRVWSACAVLLLAASVTSCAEGQFGQVVQAVGKNMAKGMCAEGQGPSNAVPEFCLYVTELRLLNHDTEADVSLTIVNRTGRRLYLTVPSWPYLTDSSGTKWAMTKNTGIVYSGYGAPLSLEPGIESQASFLFQRQGQAPSDLTFSMRGEISIAKTDSRGEPVPGQPQVTRGFNFSGIRLAQQEQPATQQLQQKSLNPTAPSAVQDAAATVSSPTIQAGTRAAVLPAASSSASAVTSAPVASVSRSVENSPDSIVGIKLGMSVEDARSAIKTHDSTFEIYEQKAQFAGIQSSEFTSFFRSWAPVRSGNSENINVAFAPPPNRPVAGIVARQQAFQREKRLLLSTVREALVARYGQPSLKSTGTAYEMYTWLLDGTGSSSARLQQYKKAYCENANVIEAFSFAESDAAFLDNRGKLNKECGKALTVQVGLDFNQQEFVTMIRSVLIDNSFIDSAHRETDVYLADGDKKRRAQEAEQAGRLGKPKL